MTSRCFHQVGRHILSRSKRLSISLAASLVGSAVVCFHGNTTRSCVAHTEMAPRIVISQESLVRRHSLLNFDMDYEIMEKLGEGGFANVYKVKHRATGFIRTAKVVDFHTKAETEVFKNEVDVMTQLNSPYIARIVEFYADGNARSQNISGQKGVIVYHFIDGHDLLDTINARITARGSFTDVETRSIVRQILKSLRYLHNMNYVHGDIKPENFMVTSDSTSRLLVKLIDFGLTSRNHINPSYIEKAGTSYYMAPEAFNRMGSDYSAKSDCWSVGIIFATIISRGAASIGRSTSFNKSAPLDAIDPKFVSNELARLEKEGVPPEYIDFIGRLLIYDPRGRLGSADALENPLMAGSYKYDPSFGPNFSATITAIRKFSDLPLLSRVFRLVAAHQINDAMVPKTRMVFRSLDAEADGLIGLDDIKLANPDDYEGIDHVIEQSDLQGNGNKLGFENFIAASMPPISAAHIGAIFNDIDTRQRGFIDAEDIAVYFSHSRFSLDTSRFVLESCRGVLGSRMPQTLDIQSFSRCVQGLSL